jgi:hypothetical protein
MSVTCIMQGKNKFRETNHLRVPCAYATRHEEMWESTNTASRILKVSGRLHVPAILPPGEELQQACPVDRRLGGHESQSGRGRMPVASQHTEDDLETRS